MSALVAYYQAMTDEQAARAANERQQAGQVADNAESERNLQGAQAYNTTQQGLQAGPLAQAEIGLRGAQADFTNAQATNFGATAASENALRLAQAGQAGAATSQTLDGLTDADPRAVAALKAALLRQNASSATPGYSKGTAKVGTPQKPGKDDTIAAKLAPGESVLNRGATEHLGAGVINHLNKLGMLRMGAQDEVAAHAKALKGHSISKMIKRGAKTVA